MDEQETKLIAKAFKDELVPHFAGLRNEMKRMIDSIADVKTVQIDLRKDVTVPELIKAEIVNPMAGQKEVQDVQVLNPTKEIDLVPVEKEIKQTNSSLVLVTKAIVENALAFTKAIKELAKSTLKVKVENQVEFPRVQEVKVLNLPEPVKSPRSLTIDNSSPKDAVPVVLTRKDGKGFYDALETIMQGMDIDLSPIIAILKKITFDSNNNVNVVGTLIEGDGKTHKVKTGSASATFTIVAAVTSKKIKVYSLSLMTASTTAVTVTFKDAASGTVVATYILQAISGTNFGIAEGVNVPSSLFETSAGNLLEMSFSGAVSVTYNLRYWDDDAT